MSGCNSYFYDNYISGTVIKEIKTSVDPKQSIVDKSYFHLSSIFKIKIFCVEKAPNYFRVRKDKSKVKAGMVTYSVSSLQTPSYKSF